jgi:hypothetical protein
MKQNLLIALGCSHTEGLGNWDMTLDYPNNFNTQHPLFEQLLHMNRQNFHKLGWPNKLGKKLGYDKVINLGFSGSATSSQMKSFLLKFEDEYFPEYNVTVVWLLTDPFRTSYIRNGIIESLLSNEYSVDKRDLFQSIYKFTSKNGERSDDDTLLDYLREEYINRNIVKTISELKGWNFISFHTKIHRHSDEIKKIYKNDNSHSFDDIGFSREADDELVSKFCGHFNQRGYAMVATNMYKFILSNHQHLIKSSPKKEIESLWIGETSFDLLRN